MAKGKALSVDLRERIVAAVRDENMTYRQAAERFVVGEASVSRFLGRVRRTGFVTPTQRRRPPTLLNDDDRELLRHAVQSVPDSTLAELRSGFVEKTGKVVSVATVGREIRRLGFTRKKSRSLRPNRRQSVSNDSAKRSPNG